MPDDNARSFFMNEPNEQIILLNSGNFEVVAFDEGSREMFVDEVKTMDAAVAWINQEDAVMNPGEIFFEHYEVEELLEILQPRSDFARRNIGL
jgi:hypothetical protein